MAKHTVVTMPGDGIGNQVLPEALRVLKAVGFDAEYIHADIGWECWCNEGNALPERTIDLLTKHKLGLFGAITSKPNKEAQAELKPTCAARAWSTTARSSPCGRSSISISACAPASASPAIR